jgi:cytochrome c oxidase subunit 2
VKQDALPGRYTSVWFQARQEGTFDIFCAEFCGSGHSLMRGEVVVLKQADFDAWLAAQRAGMIARQDMGSPVKPSTIVEQGRLAAVRHECLKCHTVDGAPHIGPTWLDLYRKQERLEGGATVLADEAYLTESMMDPLAKIVAGFQPVMPSYQGQLSGPEAAAIVEYIKTLRSGKVRPGPSEGPVYEPVRQR